MLGDHMFQEVGKNKAGCASAYRKTTCVLWLLETGTDLQRLSGWFLGFITMILTKAKTLFWNITTALKKLKESNNLP